MRDWRALIWTFAASVLLAGLVVPDSIRVGAPLRAQPELLRLAQEQPDAWVEVIVQMWSRNDRPEALVTALGGVVTKDLHIIAAFAAEMRADAARTLAANPAVRWVSLEALIDHAGASRGPHLEARWIASIARFARRGSGGSRV